MQVTVEWASPAQRTVLAKFNDKWEIDDQAKAVQKIHEMIKAVPHEVSIIIWHRVPPHPEFTRPLREYHKQQPSNTHVLVIVPYQFTSGMYLMTTWARIIETLFPRQAKIKFAKTIEEAYKLCDETFVVAA